VGRTSARAYGIIPAVSNHTRVPTVTIFETLQERIPQDFFDSIRENTAETEFLKTRKQITGKG
jgi:hypothetical protein